MFKILRNGLCLALIGIAGTVAAQGDDSNKEQDLTKITKIELVDQFDKKQRVDSSTEILVFAHDMTGNDVVELAFEKLDSDKLTTKNIVYLADISGMPSLIAKLFAIPAMRDRAYPIMLDKEGEVTSALSAKEDRVTVLFLDKLSVQKVKYAANATELRKLLAI